ncbi:MAG: chemotaxis protein CheB [Clostridiales bacterium]|jgi:two-component system chemotaxis response regulator CheB|nr:chemotaxis protein CheB [Clostridiales bacterium]
MKTKITILTTDMNIKNLLASEFKRRGYLTEVSINTFSDLGNFIDGRFANVLILDTDTLTVQPEHLRQLADDYGLYVVLLGIKNATSSLLGGAKAAINKPNLENDFSTKIFVRSIIDHIELFERSYAPVRPSDLHDVAGIGDTVVAIAASTGGTDALHTVLSGLPASMPPILIVQHMPSVFTHQFATRLNKSCKFAVKEAAISDYARANQALIAPGDFHMKVVRQSKNLMVECFRGDKLHGVRPAADILFNSMAEFMGKNVIGVVLTGMGVDGARGLHKLKFKGAKIIAQDKETSVVYGMPKAAVDLGIVDYQLPIGKLAEKIVELVRA